MQDQRLGARKAALLGLRGLIWKWWEYVIVLVVVGEKEFQAVKIKSPQEKDRSGNNINKIFRTVPDK